MYRMFDGASAFDQDLGWCVADEVDLDRAFEKTKCASTSCGVVQVADVADCPTPARKYPTAAKQALDDKTIRVAVRAWFHDRAAADAKYGHIEDWDTSGVTDMKELFCASDQLCSYSNTAAASFNDNIGAWDTSGVTTTSMALRRGRQGPQGVRLHRLRARQGREAVLAARRRGRRPGVGSLQADVRQVLGAVPAQFHPVLPSPGVSPSYNNSSRHSDTHVEREGITKAQIY